MGDIDFQNGFLCGMATRGLVRSGEQYKPVCWNDEGAYGYFYIDFRRTLQAFSLGMFNESILINDSRQISVTRVEQIGTTVYKVYCDLVDKIHGITVLNKKTTRLRFSTGELLPVFSVHLFIAGQISYLDGAYVYDKCDLEMEVFTGADERLAHFQWASISGGNFYEEVSLVQTSFDAVETIHITLT